MPDTAPTSRETVAVIGGGFTGAALALHLARTAPASIDIRVVEPRATLGAGLAYSSADPDHRMNGPIDILVLFREDPGHFGHWYQTSGERAADPDALATTGQLYCRRAAFGRYMHGLVAAHARDNASGSSIIHERMRALDLAPDEAGVTVTFEDGRGFRADHVFLALAHEKPAVPEPFESFGEADGFFADPWDPAALTQLPPCGDLLILGSALTTADVAATILRAKRDGRILVLSRRGLRPHEQGVLPPAAERLARMAASPPHFVRRHGCPDNALPILRAVRADIAALAARGTGWEAAFDDLRDAAPALWQGLSTDQRRRALRRLRAFYDVHRFRIAPQVAANLRRAEAEGRLVFLRGRVHEAVRVRDGFDIRCTGPRGASARLSVSAVINCTGPNADIRVSDNCLLAALRLRGLICPDPTGSGIAVDADCRAINATGTPSPRLTVLGPLTRGRFGDLIAVPQINAQILRILTNRRGRLAY